MSDSWPKRVDAETLGKLEFMAYAASNELAAAGVPVAAPGLLTQLSVGAEITVDPFEGGGVFIEWHVSPRLSMLAMNAARHKRTDDPAISHSATVTRVMNKAIVSILTAAGFSVQDSKADYRSLQLQVTAGPATGVQPVWGLRDDELTFPGWQPDSEDPHA